MSEIEPGTARPFDPGILEFVQRVRDTLDSMPPLAELEDDVVLSLLVDTEAEFEQLKAQFAPIVGAFRMELERRMRARRKPDSPAKISIPHPRLRIELQQQFTSWIFDVDKLREAAQLLSPDDAAKVVTYTPETIIPPQPERVIPESYGPGSWQSIVAIRDRMPDTKAAELLHAGMTRKPLEDKVTIAPIAAAAPPKKRAGKLT